MQSNHEISSLTLSQQETLHHLLQNPGITFGKLTLLLNNRSPQRDLLLLEKIGYLEKISCFAGIPFSLLFLQNAVVEKLFNLPAKNEEKAAYLKKKSEVLTTLSYCPINEKGMYQIPTHFTFESLEKIKNNFPYKSKNEIKRIEDMVKQGLLTPKNSKNRYFLTEKGENVLLHQKEFTNIQAETNITFLKNSQTSDNRKTSFSKRSRENNSFSEVLRALWNNPGACPKKIIEILEEDPNTSRICRDIMPTLAGQKVCESLELLYDSIYKMVFIADDQVCNIATQLHLAFDTDFDPNNYLKRKTAILRLLNQYAPLFEGKYLLLTKRRLDIL